MVVEYSKRDRYGRIIGRVFVGDTDTSAELVRAGHAWVYRRYSRDAELLELEQQAKEQRRGSGAESDFWASPNTGTYRFCQERS